MMANEQHVNGEELLHLLRYFGEKNIAKRGEVPKILQEKELYMEDIMNMAADMIEILAGTLATSVEQTEAARDACCPRCGFLFRT